MRRIFAAIGLWLIACVATTMLMWGHAPTPLIIAGASVLSALAIAFNIIIHAQVRRAWMAVQR